MTANATGGDVPLLAELLSLPPDSRHLALDLSPQQKKGQTFAALSRQLTGLARRQPVLIIFEDLQWADPTSLALLDLTLEQIDGMPMLLIATFRPEFQPSWTDRPHVTELLLRRLGRPESDELVQELLGSAAALSSEVIDEIVERTDGVPLFLEELTKAVLEAAISGVDESRRALSAFPARSLAVPGTLHASLMARLDRLGLASKKIAQVGAVIGREFSYEMLAAVAEQTEADLHDALRRLVHAGLVFQHGVPPQATFQFKHTLVGDAAYSTLLRGQRQALHRQVGAALEIGFPEIVETQPEILAHHFTEGGLADSAVGYWLRAGKNATTRSANLEAIGHLRRGIEVVGHLPAGASRDQLELDLQFVLGPCLIATQGPIADAALTTFERARELCNRLQEPPEQLNVLYWLAVMRGVRGELREALGHDNRQHCARRRRNCVSLESGFTYCSYVVPRIVRCTGRDNDPENASSSGGIRCTERSVLSQRLRGQRFFWGNDAAGGLHIGLAGADVQVIALPRWLHLPYSGYRVRSRLGPGCRVL